MTTDISFADRKCGQCTLCCKVMAIDELDKPRSSWCKHCAIGSGCSIYDARPESCQNFICGYLGWEMVPSHWFPAKSKLIIVSELEGNRLAIHVDPDRPLAWKQEPFYSEIRQLAVQAAPAMQQVVVCVGRRAIVILPDEDCDLGDVSDDERILLAEELGPSGLRLGAFKLHKDDPRLAGMKPGVIHRPKE